MFHTKGCNQHGNLIDVVYIDIESDWDYEYTNRWAPEVNNDIDGTFFDSNERETYEKYMRKEFL